MKISVALCTCNGAMYIKEQLNSILHQTRMPDELIICDDKSEDNTISIVENFSHVAPFHIKIVSNISRLGVTKNFEKCMKLCTGDIIFLCDQDDIWMPDKVALTVNEFIIDANIGLVFSDAVVTDANLETMGYNIWTKFGLNKAGLDRIHSKDALEYLLINYVITGATVAFKSKYLENILPIPSVWIHDAWIAINIASYSKIKAIKSPLIHYRQHSFNVIGGRKKSLLGLIRSSRNLSFLELDTEISRFKEMHVGRQFLEKTECNIKLLALISRKINHLKVRRSMYGVSFITRLRLVFLELFSFRYFKFSNGIFSALTDLILR